MEIIRAFDKAKWSKFNGILEGVIVLLDREKKSLESRKLWTTPEYFLDHMDGLFFLQ